MTAGHTEDGSDVVLGQLAARRVPRSERRNGLPAMAVHDGRRM
jgi:hypothetical protein